MSQNFLLQNGRHKSENSALIRYCVQCVVGTGKQQCSSPHFSETFLETQYLVALHEKSSYNRHVFVQPEVDGTA